jgi:hypothetical protein
MYIHQIISLIFKFFTNSFPRMFLPPYPFTDGAEAYRPAILHIIRETSLKFFLLIDKADIFFYDLSFIIRSYHTTHIFFII